MIENEFMADHYHTGIAILLIFTAAYLMVVAEERLHLKKSQPVVVAAGLIWILVGIFYTGTGRSHKAVDLLRSNLLDFAELFLFLLSAMTYINTMVERNVFDALRFRLMSAKFSLRSLFWITGLCAFFLSPIADNLTTALVMGSVVMAIARHNKSFITGSCINIVVAANAGGAFSPFGDITTLMIWQKGIVKFTEFFGLFIPALVNWLVPAFIISLTIPKTKTFPEAQNVQIKKGGIGVVILFLLTIATTVTIHYILYLPAFLGMMLGLSFLKSYGYFLRNREKSDAEREEKGSSPFNEKILNERRTFDVFNSMRELEWDTILFFYGVILCVGGLGAMGYLALASNYFYNGIGPTFANISVGFLSSILGNIPLTYIVLSMNPDMGVNQWLLLTLTAGVGGSLLSIGSAAGVALMGLARGSYTFMSHFKWFWAILLGYAASILSLMLLKGMF